MVFASTREISKSTKAVFEKVDNGEHVLVVHYGKPRAIIQRITGDDLEDYVLLNHPEFRHKLTQALKQSLQGKVTSLDEIIAETNVKLAKARSSSH